MEDELVEEIVGEIVEEIGKDREEEGYKHMTQTLEHIIAEHEAPLGAFIRARVSSEEDARDMLQDLWLQLSKEVQKQEIKQVRAWLYRVARNRIIDSYRKKSADWLEDYLYEEEGDDGYLIDSLLESGEDPEMDFLREQFWDDWFEALDSMPEKQRSVFILNEWDGITLREIAERQGENLKTIISRKGYAVKHLRLHLQLIFEEFFGE